MLVSAALERSPFDIRDGVKPERASVFTNDVYILPPKPREPLPSDVTQRRTQVYQVNCGEELVDRDI